MQRLYSYALIPIIGVLIGSAVYFKTDLFKEPVISPQHVQVGKIKKIPRMSFKDQEILCLTRNIYYEASHEPVKGKQAVGLVTLNRVKHKAYPNTVCGVVNQKTKVRSGKKVCQFSWVCGVKKVYNSKEYNSAKGIATKLYNNRNKQYDFTNGSTHFHAGSIVWPEWSQTLQYTTDIGNHVFYKIPNKRG